MRKFFRKLFNWELWPFNVIYTPLGFVWIYYCIRARAFWFFTPTNPTLTFGGFEGDSKSEMYKQLPVWCYPKTFFIESGKSFTEIKSMVMNGGLSFPFVVKPDVGMQGILFRIVETEDEWKEYHAAIPVDYIVQAFIKLPMEFSVFHIRYPGETKGKVTGFILKDYMHVVGDGRKTLEQLVQGHPKAMHRMAEMRKKHDANWNSVPAYGEKYYLSVAGNHNRGARFINLHKEIDQPLSDVFDRISNEAGNFYYGRYDLKCTSIEDLKQGKNVMILEYNGAGAEPNHIYDCGMSYFKALKVVASHWHDMYRIGKINNRKGVKYWTYFEGRRFSKETKMNFRRLQQLDVTLLI